MFWEGKRVKLRATEPDDAAFFFELQGDTERNRLLDFSPPPASRAALEDWARERSRRTLENDAFQWLIENRTGERVGSIVTHIFNPKNGTFSYALGITMQIVLPRREGGWYHFLSTEPGNVVLQGAETLHLAPQEGTVLA